MATAVVLRSLASGFVVAVTLCLVVIIGVGWGGVLTLCVCLHHMCRRGLFVACPMAPESSRHGAEDQQSQADHRGRDCQPVQT